MDSIFARLGVPDYEFRLGFGGSKIDYDPGKEESNRKKHGYSLESAVHLFERLLFDSLLGKRTRYIVSDSFMENGEVRQMHMSIDEGVVVVMVTTMRPDETVRVISFRRADKKERETFRQNTGYMET